MVQRILGTEFVYRGWLQVLKATVETSPGQTAMREIVAVGDSACLLPYDPVRGVTLLILIPRIPVIFARGPEQLLEAPAGKIETGDSAEETARREAEEEVGLTVQNLEFVGRGFAAPGTATERISLYLVEYDASLRTGPGGGLAEEHEDIEVVEMTLTDLKAAVEAGRVEDLKTLALFYALMAKRPELFRETRQ